MSASQQKKLRKSQAAVQQQKMTERQQAELKQQKKVKRMTIAFFVCIALVVVLAVGALVWNSGLIHRNVTAVSVENYNFSAAQVNYCYVDTVYAAMSDTSSYLPYFVSTGTPLDEQACAFASDSTWADYFMDSTVGALEDISALCAAAEADGYTLTEEDQASIDNTLSYMETYATLSGYSNADQYLRAYYGNGSNLESYKEYITMKQLATSYQNKVLADLEASYTDEQITGYIAEHTTDLTTYTYRMFNITATVLGDLDAATAAAEDMVENCKGDEALFIEKTQEYCSEDAAETYAEEDATLKSSLGMNLTSEEILAWLSDPARVEGDTTSIAITSTTDGEETVTGYNVLYFVEAEDNSYALANVRHILIQPENGVTDTNGNTTYSDEDWAAAQKKAEALLADWEAGKATEDTFATLANENSADTGSNENGGLYEDVYPGQMVTSFNDWCFDDTRAAGDTGIVKTDYGYHIMYYVGDSETTYAELMAKSELYNTDAEAWYSETTDPFTATRHGFGMSLVNTGLTLTSN